VQIGEATVLIDGNPPKMLPSIITSGMLALADWIELVPFPTCQNIIFELCLVKFIS